jgi:uncharacterized protein
MIDLDEIWRLAEARFPLGEQTDHGPDHWRRVEANGIWIADRTPGSDLMVVRIFAAMHDSCRQNEYRDPEHGPRAAAWAVELRSSVLRPLVDQQFGLLCEAMIGHDRGRTSDDPTIGACWDADRLDLPRVFIIPEAKYMSTAAGRSRVADSGRDAR